MRTLAKILVLIVVLTTSCRKDKVSEDNGSADQIPNSSGDYWKYKIQTLDGEQNGFLEVKIIRKSILPDGRCLTTWIYSYPEFTDTVYKVLSDTTFEEYNSYPFTSEEIFPSMRYVFPLEPEMKWLISPYADSVEVMKDTTLNLAAGSFDHTLQMNLIRARFIGNYFNHTQYWFTPHVGITRFKYNVFILGPDKHNGIYELFEYKLGK
jgi:hypothetical protein